MKTGLLEVSLSLLSAGWCRRYSGLFRYAHMVVEEPPPPLWPASHHSASLAVNFLPEDSVSGVQLCPEVLGVKKEQSNYSTSRLTLVRASLLTLPMDSKRYF